MKILNLLNYIFQDNKKFILFVFLLGFTLRVIFVLSLQSKFYFSDSLIYEDCAIRILEGKGFSNYEREPLYPLWMAFVYLLAGGKNIVLLRILESVFGAFLCVILFYLGKSIFNRPVGVIAAIISSIYPLFVFLPALNYPTILSTFFISIGVYLASLVSIHHRISLSILAWIFFGLSAMTVAPTASLALAAAVWMLFFSSLKMRYRLIHGGVVSILFLLTLTPWTVRQYSYHQELILIRSDATRQMLLFEGKEKNSHDKASVSAKKKIMSIYHNPSIFLNHFGRNFLSFFRPYPSQNLTSANPNYNQNVYEKDKRITKENPFSVEDFSRIINAITCGPVLLFAVIGLILPRWPLRKSLLLVLPILALACTYGFYYGKVRYRLPVEPLMIILAAATIESTYSFLIGKLRQDGVNFRIWNP